jgi:hypothetical protein
MSVVDGIDARVGDDEVSGLLLLLSSGDCGEKQKKKRTHWLMADG